jgi:hypothetical protein
VLTHALPGSGLPPRPYAKQLVRERNDASCLASQERDRSSPRRRTRPHLDSGQRGTDERASAKRVPARRYDGHVGRIEPLGGSRNTGGILDGASRFVVGKQRHVPAVPGGPHQLGLACAVPPPTPTREENRVCVSDELLRVPQPRRAHLVERVATTARVTQNGNDVHAQLRRRQPTNASSVAAIVTTTMIAFFPCSFDSPPARGRISTGTSSTRNPASSSRRSACTSGASLV